MIKDLQLSATELREQDLGKDQLIEDYLLKSQALGDLQGDGAGGVLNKLFWIGEWDAQNTPYAKNAFGKEGAFAGVSLADGNTDHIAPQLSGDPEFLYQGTYSSASDIATQVIAGQRYTIPEGLFILKYSIEVIAGNNYEIYSRTDIGATNEAINQVASFEASISGLIENGILVFAAEGKVFDFFGVISEPVVNPVITTLPYNYTTPNNTTSPLSGQIAHADKSAPILRVSYTDNNGGDNAAFLTSLISGDVIEGAGQRWSIQSTSDGGTFREFGIAPARQGAPDGVQDFNFETVPPTSITYAQDVDYWLSNPNVQGFFTATGGLGDVVFDQTARLLDIQIQRVIASPNWDLLPFIGEGGLEDGVSALGGADRDFNFESLALSQTNADFNINPVTKINATAGLTEGDYKITVSFSCTARTNRRVAVGLYINDVLHEDVFEKEAKDNNDNMWITKSFKSFFPSANTNFKLKFGRTGGGGGNQVSLSYARIIIEG